MDKSDLGNRMKAYENVSRNFLIKRMPVIIRLDGKAFHSFTKGFERPFDYIFLNTMQDTMKYLCENIQGCVLGYTQSDEITLVLIDYKRLNSSAWFDNNIQKMCSVSASMATMAFNKNFELNVKSSLFKKETETYLKKVGTATFDSRVFNVPKEDVCNCLIWRQQDATRNSIQSVGQANFSQKELHKKSCNVIQDMLMEQKGINWNDLPDMLKRGSCCVNAEYIHLTEGVKSSWVVDVNIPIFTKFRKYIEDRILYFPQPERGLRASMCVFDDFAGEKI